jgi:predicted MFS family arabinose efflux permease
MSTDQTTTTKGSPFELWMISNLALGAGFSAFVALLIPPYVTQTTGNAADAGVVMAVMSLAAVLGPILGNFADKHRAHRIVLSLGIFGMALAFAFFAMAADNTTFYALDAILMGIGVAAVSAVAPVFIVGAGLDTALEARRLTVFNLVAPVGQVIGGAIMGAAAAAGMSYGDRFWIAAIMMLLTGLVTWFTSGKPAQRVLDTMDTQSATVAAETTGKAQANGLRTVLFSTFGMYLLVLVTSSIANNGVNNQISNILPNVYGVSEATTSGLISLAGLLNIAVFFLAGWWMGRSGMMGPFMVGHVARMVGSLGMAVLGLMTNNAPLLLVAVSMQVMYQGLPFVRLAQPVGAIRFSTVPAGAASGWVIGAAAVGSFLGSVLGGWLADAVGFNAINWMAAISAAIAVILTFVSLVPADRKKRQEEKAAQAA